MHAKVIVLDDAPSGLVQLREPLRSSGFEVEIVGNDPACWPLAGACAADLVLQDLKPVARGGAPPALPVRELEDAGFMPVVVFEARVFLRERGAGVPSTGGPGAAPGVVPLLGHIRTLLALQRAALGPRAPASGPGKAAGFDCRDLFHAHLAREFSREGRGRAQVSCVLVALAGLDELPVARGLGPRPARDRLSGVFLDALREGVRTSDFVCRYEAATFAVLLDDTGMDGARHCVRRLVDRIEGRTCGRLDPFEPAIRGEWELCVYLRSGRVRGEEPRPFEGRSSLGQAAGGVLGTAGAADAT